MMSSLSVVRFQFFFVAQRASHRSEFEMLHLLAVTKPAWNLAWNVPSCASGREQVEQQVRPSEA